ncbi:trigger factor [Rhabdaerophilum sp. SD176]|uniref:trigger factor n=1 Tax=Rhabdaerophilum sp. SD176 TaxID=2983548 RepID=UPI0024DFF12F|nr:trigger factor [Rhabdaerophilum sp. SD176]
MQVTQTLAEGLKRQFKVVIAAADLGSRFESELETLRERVNLNGFRPGKVPVAHLRRVYGKSVMADVVQNAVNDANKKIVEEHDIRLASEPKINFTEDQTVIEQVLAGKADLDFSVDVEVLPKIEIADHSAIEIIREVAEIAQEDIDSSIQRMAAANRPYSPRGANDKAQDGDKLTIDFVGTIDGVAFEGGTAEGVDLIIGSGQFIPGFEEQLVGAKKGEQKVVKTMFPELYQARELAGKAAEFAVTVQEIQAPGDQAIDDELAKKFGLDDVEKLRDAVRASILEEMTEQTRQKMKRQLLDGLDKIYTFDLPSTMLEEEFSTVWRQLTADMARSGQSFGEGEEEKAREEYRTIAARRVRLGLVLAEIGAKSNVKIEESEIRDALIARARSFPGQEKQVFEYFTKNPEALAQIRAPLFEEKVIDLILMGLKITDKRVTRAELMDDDVPEAEEKAEKPKKAKAKKAE